MTKCFDQLVLTFKLSIEIYIHLTSIYHILYMITRDTGMYDDVYNMRMYLIYEFLKNRTFTNFLLLR